MRARIAGLQSRGQWGARDFDKVVFTLPIPRFDPSISRHTELAEAARGAESVAASLTFPQSVKFQRARGLVRTALEDAGVAQRIEVVSIFWLGAGVASALSCRPDECLSAVARRAKAGAHRRRLKSEGGWGSSVAQQQIFGVMGPCVRRDDGGATSTSSAVPPPRTPRRHCRPPRARQESPRRGPGG